MVSVIGRKLGTGFTLVIIAMLATILLGLFSMDNSIKSLKLVAEDQLNAAISTMDIRINRSERNFALRNIILYGEEDEILANEEANFKKYQIEMSRSIKRAVQDLNSVAFSDSIKDLFVEFYNEIHDFDRAKSIKQIYKSKGEDKAIKEIREDRDRSDEMMFNVVEILRKQTSIETTKAQKKTDISKILLIIAPFLGLIIASMIAHLTTRGIINSIKYIYNSAAHIYAGELDTPIKIHTHNEFHELASSFDRMRKSLISAKKLLEKKEQ